jgi:hypothetical protein
MTRSANRPTCASASSASAARRFQLWPGIGDRVELAKMTQLDSHTRRLCQVSEFVLVRAAAQDNVVPHTDADRLLADAERIKAAIACL